MKEGFILQVVRPAGAAICRLHLRRRHLALAGIALVILAGLFGLHLYKLQTAAQTVARLQAERADQQRKLDVMEEQTKMLQRATLDSQRSIERIERSLGTPDEDATTSPAGRLHAAIGGVKNAGAGVLAERLKTLAQTSAVAQAQAHRLAGLAARVLNLRRLASIARARTLAAIPSLNPTGGGINAAFGWRTDPFPEFHKGLDLAADYGTPVHAAAAGVVALAGWEGGFGRKVDIDHGNGFHTWYCHLSQISVVVGQRVSKGQQIAAAGSTGESTGPHLHYQVMHDGIAIDPLPFLNGVPANILATLPHTPGVQ